MPAIAPREYLEEWGRREGPGAVLNLADWLGLPRYPGAADESPRYPLLDVLAEQLGMDVHQAYIRTLASIRMSAIEAVLPTMNLNILEQGLVLDLIGNAQAVYPTPSTAYSDIDAPNSFFDRYDGSGGV